MGTPDVGAESATTDASQYGADVLAKGYLGEAGNGSHGYNMLPGGVVWAGELADALQQIATAIGGTVVNAQSDLGGGKVWFSRRIEDPAIIDRAFQPLFAKARRTRERVAGV